MPEHLRTLNTAELYIRQRAQRADASPFAAHCVPEEAHKLKFRASFVAFVGGDTGRIPEALRRWPLTSVWSFADALSAAYGEEDYAIYRVLDQAFRVDLSSNARLHVRTQISDAFRSICRKFGLCYEGDGRRVNDYLAQAGIANAQLHHVARAFLLAERAFGPAPPDNTSALRSWGDEAADFLPQGLKIPRMVMEIDETGYYAALFARCRQHEQPRNPFEARFFEEIGKAERALATGQSRPERIPRPSLIWGEAGLALTLPRVEGRLTVSFGGETRKLRGGQTWPLSTPWPEHIDWSFDGRNERLAVFPTRRHLLAFDQESGRLIKSIDTAGESEVVIDGRQIVLVATKPFAAGGEESLPIGSDGHARHCLLGASAVVVHTDGVAINLRAKPRPRLWIEHGAIAKGQKGYLLSSSAVLGIDLGDAAAEEFDLALSVGVREQLVPLTATGDTSVLTCEILDDPALAPALVPIRAELRLRGSQRAQVRYKAWLWPGLVGLTDGLVFESPFIPANYCAERSRHIVTDGTAGDKGRLCLDTDAAYETATLAFTVGGERVAFEIPRPGINLSFMDVDGRSIPLKLGETLMVLDEDKGGSLIIRCPDRLAALNVRGRIEPEAFRYSATRVLSLADLTTPATRDDVVLCTSSSAAVPILLVRIVPALAPQSFVPRTSWDGLSVDIRLGSPIDAVRLALDDEAGGSSEYDCALMHREVPGPTPSWLYAEIDTADTHHIVVRIKLTEFHGNFTLVRILVRPAGSATFRPLRNPRGDTYALLLTRSEQYAQAHELDAADAQKRFATINSWMQLCFSRESWDFIGSEIEPRWTALGRAVAAGPEGPSQLLAAAHVPRLPGTARSWVPLSHPLQILPSLYGAPPRYFLPLTSDTSEGAEHLALLAETTGRSIPQIHNEAFGISSAFLGAFANIRAAHQNSEELRGFGFATYSREFTKQDTDPGARWFWGPGDTILGPAHYGAALGRLIDRFHEAGIDEEGANDHRIRAVMALCNEARMQREPTPPLPCGIEISHALIEAAPAFTSGFARASRRGSADAYLAGVANRLGKSDRRVAGDAAFLIRLGPELFAFFLLLWELASERSLS